MSKEVVPSLSQSNKSKDENVKNMMFTLKKTFNGACGYPEKKLATSTALDLFDIRPGKKEGRK